MDTFSAVVVDGLTKRYGSRTVVDRLGFRIPRGSVAGLVGPNGAGKTTVLRMLLGLVRPDGGTATVNGVSIDEPARYLPGVGALIESPAFYPGLSGRRNLTVYATLAGIALEQVSVVLDRLDLTARAGDAYQTYSLGMRQRLGIAAALLGQPRLVVLDEPTNGLDPAGIRDMRAIIRSINDDGRTVLVTSHLLNEIQQVCSWLIVVRDGRLGYQGEIGAVEDLEERYFRILQGDQS
ncbi:MAG TPA: ATP-binding cassette domain-containing protein [Micromonosporaceae bacterium]